jgi:RNA polymerase sigma-70 factor (ECF subfamily)
LSQYVSYSEQELLEAIRHDNEKAFEEIFNRYWSKVYRTAYSLVRSREVTQEIVQGLFISLWDRRASIVVNNLLSYLTMAARNRALDVIESQLVRQKHWDYYKRFIPQQACTTEQDIAFNELAVAIEEKLELLPEKSKRVFMLNRIEGRSVQEIANLLNLSEKAIQYHLTKSTKELRLHLKDYIISVVICFYLFP